MTRKEALEQLSSDSAHERLKAARFLARNSDPVDVPDLRSALQGETVSYVRTSLNLALTRVANSPSLAANYAFEEREIPHDLKGDYVGKCRSALTQGAASAGGCSALSRAG